MKKNFNVLSQSFKLLCCGVLVGLLLPEGLKAENKSELSGLYAIQQDQVTVSGKITDMTTGEGLPGVNILIKGTVLGTVSDANGDYTLNVPSTESVLIYSYIGYVSEEIPVGTQSTIDVSLVQDITSLQEVVVVGYGTMKKSEVTSSVASVTSEDFNKVASRSPLDLVQGKVAGLNITRARGGNPNSSSSIQLRGVTSLSGNNSPLIVVDGIPGGNLDLIQQNDIESIDVLKDGSAAAIYGTRGNGGVILITTKKGKAGDTKFNYNAYVRRDFVDNAPDVLSASEYRNALDQGYIVGDDLGGNADLFDEMINKDNLSTYHTLSAAGGGDNSNYRASVFYKKSEGIAVENDREEFGGRFNFNSRGLNDKLSMQTNIAINLNQPNLLGGYVNENDQSSSDFIQSVLWNPTLNIKQSNGQFNELESGGYNPISQYAHRLYERDQQTLSTDVKFTLDIAKGLTASAFGAYQRNSYNDREYISKNDFALRESTSYKGMGYASKYNYLNYSRVFESTFNYNKIIDQHSFSALAGYSYQYQTTEEYSLSNTGFTTDVFEDWNLGAGLGINDTGSLQNPSMGSHKEDNTLIAFFGRVNYNFDEKYFAQFILRREGSSRFGDNNKWGNFPAVSLGWAIHNEGFMSDLPVINKLKLRAGYGVTGNQGIPNYQSLVLLGTGGVYLIDGEYYQTYGPNSNPNPDLKWEKKQELNLGLDFAVLDNRISGSIDVYRRKTVDLLYNYTAQQPPFIQPSVYTNVGSILNRGVEVVIDGLVMESGDFNWRATLAGNYQYSKLDELSNENFKASYLEVAKLPNPGNLPNAIRIEDGVQIGSFYGNRYAGLTEDGKWLFYNKDGDVVTKEEVTQDDKAYIGNGVPKYNASITNTLTYKNFDFSFMFRGKFDFDILNAKDIYYGNPYTARGFNVLKSAITDHRELNDDPVYSDYYLEKGDFVKLDNITLGYTVPMKNSYVSNLRFYVTGTNLFTFTGYSGIDPEIQDTGLTTGIDGKDFYPRTKAWTIGVNVAF